MEAGTEGALETREGEVLWEHRGSAKRACPAGVRVAEHCRTIAELGED